MISALNFKPYSKGALIGFFDLEFHGMVVKGCRLMDGKNGVWVALPQKEGEKNGERQWFDFLYMTPPLSEHVRRLVLADLEAQGCLELPASDQQESQDGRYNQQSNQDPRDGEDIPF